MFLWLILFSYCLPSEQSVWKRTSTSQRWIDIAISSTGQYQSAITNSSFIFTSSDYGATWQYGSHHVPSPHHWRGIALSTDSGQVQSVCVYGDYIYISNDFGMTWEASLASNQQSWMAIAVSSTGQYISAVTNGDFIFKTSDGGKTWSSAAKRALWNDIAVSSTGKYQSATVSNYFISLSSDYGETWYTSASIQGWTAIAISSDGRIQAATTNDGYIYVAFYFGLTWYPFASHQNWMDISLSSSGTDQIACTYDGFLYFSNNSGVDWVRAADFEKKYWRSVGLNSDGTLAVAAADGNSNSSSEYIYEARIPTSSKSHPDLNQLKTEINIIIICSIVGFFLCVIPCCIFLIYICRRYKYRQKFNVDSTNPSVINLTAVIEV